MKRISYVLTIAAMLFFSCSEDEPVEPQPPEAVLDSTSHDFEWEIICLGDDHSHLKDVVAISDSNVWVVGDIRIRDSLKNYIKHNAAHWDGRQWRLLKVPSPTIGSFPPDFGVPPLECVHAFSSDNIIFGVGTILLMWDGKKYSYDTQLYEIANGSFRKFWGTPNACYIVGDNGTCFYYNGKDYIKVDVPTSYDINDIWGIGDTAICIASNWLWEGGPTDLIRLVKGKAKRMDEHYANLPRAMKSLWFTRTSHIWSVGNGIIEWDGMKWLAHQNVGRAYKMCVRGANESDVFTAGHLATVAHYNGNTWKSYDEFDADKYYFHSLSVLTDHVWIVASDKIFRRPTIIHGKRRL